MVFTYVYVEKAIRHRDREVCVHWQLLTNYDGESGLIFLLDCGFPTKQSELGKRATVDILPPPPPTIAMQ